MYNRSHGKIKSDKVLGHPKEPREELEDFKPICSQEPCDTTYPMGHGTTLKEKVSPESVHFLYSPIRRPH